VGGCLLDIGKGVCCRLFFVVSAVFQDLGFSVILYRLVFAMVHMRLWA